MFATVVIKKLLKKVLEQAEFLAMQELAFREKHLKENIKNCSSGSTLRNN